MHLSHAWHLACGLLTTRERGGGSGAGANWQLRLNAVTVWQGVLQGAHTPFKVAPIYRTHIGGQIPVAGKEAAMQVAPSLVSSTCSLPRALTET